MVSRVLGTDERRVGKSCKRTVENSETRDPYDFRIVKNVRNIIENGGSKHGNKGDGSYRR